MSKIVKGIGRMFGGGGGGGGSDPFANWKAPSSWKEVDERLAGLGYVNEKMPEAPPTLKRVQPQYATAAGRGQDHRPETMLNRGAVESAMAANKKTIDEYNTRTGSKLYVGGGAIGQHFAPEGYTPYAQAMSDYQNKTAEINKLLEYRSAFQKNEDTARLGAPQGRRANEKKKGMFHKLADTLLGD